MTPSTNFARTILVVLTAAFASGNVAVARKDIAWQTGAAFQRQLAEPIGIHWASNPLRSAIEELAKTRKVAVLIDRRVDPGQKIDISLKDMPLRAVFEAIARSRGLEIACLGSVVYVGPSSAARSLVPMASSLDKSIRRLPTAVRTKLRQLRPLQWDDLATPRELLEELAREGGIEISGLQRVPHDLWAAADLPAMTLTDRIALIAVQFDLAPKITNRGRQVELTPFSAAIEPASGNRAPTRPAVSPKAERPTTLEQTRIDRISIVEKPLGPVLRQLANRLGFELRIDHDAIAAAGISLDQRVSVRVEKVTIDELLHQLLKSTGLTFHRRDRVVEIVPSR